MEETISIKEIYQILKKRLWLIILSTVILTSITAVVSYFFLTPIYEAKTEIIVNQTKDDKQMYSSNEVQTNLQLVTTYTGIIKSPVVLDKVSEKLGLDNENNLKEQISVANEKNSQIISIVVQNSDPVMAVEIANEVAQIFQTEIANIMNVDNVTILAKAEAEKSLSPVKPNPTVNMVIAFVFGLIIGSSIAFLMEYLDNTIKTETDIEKLLDQSVLGVVSTHIQANVKGARPQTRKFNSSVRSDSFGS